MKILKLIFMNLKERFFVYIILAAQTFVAIFTINLSLGQMQYYRYPYSFISKSDLKNAVYMYLKTPERAYQDNKNTEYTLKTYIQKLSNVKHISSIEQTVLKIEPINIPSNINSDHNYINIHMYDDFLLNTLDSALSQGKWSDIWSESKDLNYVIISSSLEKYFKIGDELTARIQGKSGEQQIRIKIIGVLKNSNYILNLSRGGDALNLSSILGKCEDLIISRQLRTIEGNIVEGTSLPGKILYMNDLNAKNQTITQWKEVLNDIGWVNSIEEMAEQQKKLIKNKMVQQMTINIILLLLVVAGLGGNNILMTYRQMKVFSLYYLCGAKWRTCMLINSIANIVIILIPSALAYLILLLQTNAGRYSNVILSIYNLIISVLFILILYFTSSVFVLIKLYRSSPIMALRRYE